MWRDAIASRDVYVARVEGEVVGFSSPLVAPDGRHRVGSRYVLPSFQGRGAGSRLMRRNLAWHGATPVYLTVVAYNARTIEFYQRFGFQETGNRVVDLTARDSGDKELPEIEMVRAVGG